MYICGLDVDRGTGKPITSMDAFREIWRRRKKFSHNGDFVTEKDAKAIWRAAIRWARQQTPPP